MKIDHFYLQPCFSFSIFGETLIMGKSNIGSLGKSKVVSLNGSKRVSGVEVVAPVPVAPSNRYYVEMKEGEFRNKSDGGLYIETMYNPGEHAEVTGIIKSVPRRGGIPGLRVGDEIAFSYLVVYSEEVIGADGDEVFYEDEQIVPTIVSWSNKLGVTIERHYLLNDKYRGIKIVSQRDKDGSVSRIVDDVVEGKFGVVESWLEKNKFRERAGKVDVNCLDLDGKKYWSVDTEFVYAVKRGDVIECVPGYYLCSRPAPVVPFKFYSATESAFDGERAESLLVDEYGQTGKMVGVKLEQDATCWVEVLRTSYGSDVTAGSQVYVSLKHVPEYKFWGLDCVLVREDQILGTRAAGEAAEESERGIIISS